MKYAVLVVFALMLAQTVSADTLTFDDPLSGWTTDRHDPASFAIDNSTFAGNNVLTIKIDGSQQQTSSFYNYQGKLHAFPLTGGTQTYSIEQYVDATNWGSQDINAGFWGVGNDSSSATSAYPIIVYRQGTGVAVAGYYSFDYMVGGWNYLGAATANAWNTLKIQLTPGVGMTYSVNGTQLGATADPDTASLSDVILNTYNFGQNYQVSYDNLSATSVTPLPSAAMAGGLLLGGFGLTRRRRAA